MGNEKMQDLKKVICKELEQMAEKRDLSSTELDFVYKLIVAKEKLLRIEELEEDLGYSNEGMSNRMSRRSRYSDESYDDYSGSRRGSRYSGGYSNEGRNSYSMANSRDMVSERIRKMMDEESMSEHERRILQDAYEQIKH